MLEPTGFWYYLAGVEVAGRRFMDGPHPNDAEYQAIAGADRPQGHLIKVDYSIEPAYAPGHG